MIARQPLEVDARPPGDFPGFIEMQHDRFGAGAEFPDLAVQGPELCDAEPRIGSFGTFTNQEFAAVVDDFVVAAIRDLYVEAQRAVVRGVRDVGMDIELVPADAIDAREPGLGQARTEAARPKSRASAFEIVGVVDAYQVANGLVLLMATYCRKPDRLLRFQRRQNPSVMPR